MKTLTHKPYVIHRTLTNFLTRWPCGICNGHTEKDAVLYCYTDADGDDHSVCDECAAAGVEAIPGRLHAKAERLRALAADLDRHAAQDWELTRDLDVDPEVIADLIRGGTLARCPQCDELLGLYGDWLADGSERTYITCPTHGETTLTTTENAS